MDARADLLERERERWTRLRKLLAEVPPSRAEKPTLNPDGWSVRDLVWHMACWNDVVAAQLNLMRAGAFDDRFEWNTEENNARFLEAGRSIPFAQALASLERSRAELVDAMERLDDVPSRALELFSEPAYKHADDHLPELRRFLGKDPPGDAEGWSIAES